MAFVPLIQPPDECDTAPLWFCVGRSVVLILEEDLSPELAMAADSTHFLGTLDGRPCWAAAMPEGVGEGYVDLFSLYASVDETTWALAGRAVQIVEWERTHRYCGRCATETIESRGERARKCPKCGLLAFPRLAPAVITVVTRGNELLLARNVNFRGGMFSAIAGFVEPGESLESAVRREVYEEVGITVGDVRYFGSQPWPFPHSLMIGFLSEWESGEIVVDPTEIAEASWFKPGALPSIPPPLSIARKLIDAVVEKLAL
jgi:NAD+ diphosphatase